MLPIQLSCHSCERNAAHLIFELWIYSVDFCDESCPEHGIQHQNFLKFCQLPISRLLRGQGIPLQSKVDSLVSFGTKGLMI